MGIERTARRGFPVVVVLGVAAAAYLQARGAGLLLGTTLRAGSTNTAVKAAEAITTTSSARSGRAILERNPFDSSFTPVGMDASTTTKLTGADQADPLSWPDCEDVRVLIVTESKDPWWSMTTIALAGDRPRLRRVGDGVAGKEIAFIGYNPRSMTPSVWLVGNGTFCQSALFRRDAPAAGLSEPAPPRSEPSGDAEFRVDRSVVDAVLEDPASLLQSVRVVPERKDGALVGLRLFGVRPDSLLGRLGVKNGDRLESVNGFDVITPQQALEAYARLRTSQRLRVRLIRDGRPVEISVNII